jgi:putative transposase
MVTYLCKIADVSRSGYYAWCEAKDLRSSREEQDWQDYLMIEIVFNAKKQKAGFRTIQMVLENDYQIKMNHKKILRLMKKFNLFTKVRSMKPYRKLAKATQEHKTLPNLLNRQFHQTEPGKVLLTDITYTYFGGGQPAYLSTVKDVATREIVAFDISRSLSMDIAYNTLNRLQDTCDGTPHPEAMLHSDQGFHYTHPEFQKRVKTAGFQQSMSRRGNCLDNAPMESFFGHFKDEVDFKQCKTFEELHDMISEYIEEYNTQRYQYGLKKMTPEQFRGHLLAV